MGNKYIITNKSSLLCCISIVALTVTSVTTYANGLNCPIELVFDSSQNLYCLNYNANTISKISSGGVATTLYSLSLAANAYCQ